ncbi:MAG: YbaK/EbsC family protein [Solirubrobacteraceae bacterium]
MTDQSLGAIATTRVDAIAQFLEGEKIQYELVEHDPVISAAAEARVAHTPPDQVAKTIVLHDRSAYVIAAIPASYRLDLHKLRELLGATRQLRLAGEGEIAREFPSLEVGAVPPFGPMVPAAEVIDRALMEQERILCPAGDHRHSVLVDPRDVARITAARIADICQD